MYVSLYNCMFVTINVRLNEINMFKPRHHRFNHVVLVNRICVAMNCLEINMVISSENEFGLLLQRIVLCKSLDTNSTCM